MKNPTHQLPLVTLLLMISFASVNAVLFTPALPNIAHFFAISDSIAQQTITWFLIGYAVGQLLYGPLANRFGRKKALFAGVSLQIDQQPVVHSRRNYSWVLAAGIGAIIVSVGFRRWLKNDVHFGQ